MSNLIQSIAVTTAVACLLLLAQPVYAQELRLFPTHLLGLNAYLNLNHSILRYNSKFCWRWIQGHKVLTIEEGPADLQDDGDYRGQLYNQLYPPYTADRKGNFDQGLDLHSTFFATDLVEREKIEFRIVKLTNLYPVGSLGYSPQQRIDNFEDKKFYPFNLVGTKDYRNGINEQRTKFNWQIILNTKGEQIPAITLED